MGDWHFFRVARRPEKYTAAIKASRRHILIVEDHGPTRAVMARLVEAQGFTTLTAATVTEALQLAATGEVGFLISDLGLNDGDGWQLMTELHTRWGINGVAISGFGMQDDVAHSENAGFLLHLTKPIDHAALQQILDLARLEIDLPETPE